VSHTELLKAAKNAAATIGSIYQWVDRVEASGGATSISGVAECHAMLRSLNNNRERIDKLVIAPLLAAIAQASPSTTAHEGDGE
jgi:hypothetical protein